MSKTLPEVPLAEIAKPISRSVEVVPGQNYRTIGVKWWGEGAYERQTIDGSGTAAKTLSLVRQGDLIINKIWVRHGSTAIAGADVDGCAASGEFPTFTLDESRVAPQWLHWQTKTRGFWAKCDALSQGTSGKNRIKPELFLTIRVPLPPLAEQRRVVARIEELAAQIYEARTLRQQAAAEAEALDRHIARDLFPETSDGVVSDWINFQTGYAFKSEWFSESGVRLARNANVGHGTLDWSESVRLPESRRAEFPRFELQADDILITLDRPIISTGVKVARVRKADLPCLLLQRVARAQFQNNEVLPEYFFRWLRSPHFTSAIDPGRSNGVPHISHKDIEKIPFVAPPLAEQRRIVAELDALQAEVDALKRLQAETAAELDALLPAILDRAFKGEL
jgi:type I restriction enzyme S subunit